MHPGQYTVLNSPEARVVEAARAELLYHARFMDALGLSSASKIVIHLGGVYGDKPAALARLASAWKALPGEVRARLALENDERLFSVYDALDAGESLGAPVVFDRFHHRVHGDPAWTPIPALLKRACRTWRRADGRPKVHFSSQEPGARPGTHDVSIRADEFREFLVESSGLALDVMIEARGKEDAAREALAAARKAGRLAGEVRRARVKAAA
jgi:UV DNA damage endonuclease